MIAAQQPNMEWRPKSSQSSRLSNSLTKQNQTTEVAILSESLAKSNVSEDQHVIIPEHLRVPDAEKTNLVFGSFDAVKGSEETNSQPSLGYYFCLAQFCCHDKKQPTSPYAVSTV
jgi:hypothetical protein